MFADLDALLGLVVGGIHVTPERGLLHAFAHAVDRAQPTKRLVGPIPVVQPYDTRPTAPMISSTGATLPSSPMVGMRGRVTRFTFMR